MTHYFTGQGTSFSPIVLLDDEDYVPGFQTSSSSSSQSRKRKRATSPQNSQPPSSRLPPASPALQLSSACVPPDQKQSSSKFNKLDSLKGTSTVPGESKKARKRRKKAEREARERAIEQARSNLSHPINTNDGLDDISSAPVSEALERAMARARANPNHPDNLLPLPPGDIYAQPSTFPQPMVPWDVGFVPSFSSMFNVWGPSPSPFPSDPPFAPLPYSNSVSTDFPQASPMDTTWSGPSSLTSTVQGVHAQAQRSSLPPLKVSMDSDRHLGHPSPPLTPPTSSSQPIAGTSRVTSISATNDPVSLSVTPSVPSPKIDMSSRADQYHGAHTAKAWGRTVGGLPPQSLPADSFEPVQEQPSTSLPRLPSQPPPTIPPPPPSLPPTTQRLPSTSAPSLPTPLISVSPTVPKTFQSPAKKKIGHSPPLDPKSTSGTMNLHSPSMQIQQVKDGQFINSNVSKNKNFDFAPNPSCTLVLEQLPKQRRMLAWIKQWAFSTIEKTAPGKTKNSVKSVALDAKVAKALVEFSSAELARKVWDSDRLGQELINLPSHRLKGLPRDDLIKAFYFRIQHVVWGGEGAGVGEIEEGEVVDDEEGEQEHEMVTWEAGVQLKGTLIVGAGLLDSWPSSTSANNIRQVVSVLSSPKDPENPSAGLLSANRDEDDDVDMAVVESSLHPEPAETEMSSPDSPDLPAPSGLSKASNLTSTSADAPPFLEGSVLAYIVEENRADSSTSEIKRSEGSSTFSLHSTSTLPPPHASLPQRPTPTLSSALHSAKSRTSMRTPLPAPVFSGIDKAIPTGPKALQGVPTGPKGMRTPSSVSPSLPSYVPPHLPREPVVEKQSELHEEEIQRQEQQKKEAEKAKRLLNLEEKIAREKVRLSLKAGRASKLGAAPNTTSPEHPTDLDSGPSPMLKLSAPLNPAPRHHSSRTSTDTGGSIVAPVPKLEDLAESFLSQTFGELAATPPVPSKLTPLEVPISQPRQSRSPSVPNTLSTQAKLPPPSRISSSRDKHGLMERQKRLEAHIQQTKTLMTKLTLATTKEEKNKLLRLIREEKKMFDEAEQKFEEAKVKQAEIAAKSWMVNIKWPESRVEDGILMVSDDEEDSD